MLIAETEIVEKNANNTNELRISTSIAKLWLNEDEEGAAKINAALREIYEAAEAEMEAGNQEILNEYLFEDGVLQENLDEWLLYPLDEWLAISGENYVASIEYVDENYLCLSMNGDYFVAGGAHGEYWSDYYVFNRTCCGTIQQGQAVGGCAGTGLFLFDGGRTLTFYEKGLK